MIPNGILNSWGILHPDNVHVYTCQLFPRYECEIFILGVLGFLKTTQSFPKIPEIVFGKDSNNSHFSIRREKLARKREPA